ncbi:MAG: hypothetical protein K0R90_1355 [Oscillospiraceae bacterium]|jgi:hypothetical protein|nr:hypothetical protein [Oscillospiraceae bacterium]
MARSSKPISVIKQENKSHRTKAEIAQREQAEQSLITGILIKEWKEVKENPIAHKEFVRIKKLLQKIDKNDGLHEGIINRYALLKAECVEFEERKKELITYLEKLEDKESEMKFKDYIKSVIDLQKQIASCDDKVMSKRRMMFDIEKENLMTIASALKSIPKKPKEETTDPESGDLFG